jgi:hypothetical protein
MLLVPQLVNHALIDPRRHSRQVARASLLPGQPPLRPLRGFRVDAGVSPPKFKWISDRSEAAADFFQRLLIGLCINVLGAEHPSVRIEELASILGHGASP